MTIKESLTKILLGRNINKELATAVEENHKAHDEYNNACQDNNALKEELCALTESLKSHTESLASLIKENERLDSLLSQLMEIKAIDEAQESLENILNDYKTKLNNLKVNLNNNEQEHDKLQRQLEKIQDEKINLDRDIEILNQKIESSKKEREQQIGNILNQRKSIKETLATHKEKWQANIEEFNIKIVNANKLDLLELRHKCDDYETKIKNAIETK